MPGTAETGRFGEELATQYLRDKGYEILERGWRSGHLEIDIIARLGDVIHIVEVKCRRNRASAGEDFSPEDAMTPAKRLRLMLALENYMRISGFSGDFSLDLIAVNLYDGVRGLRHYEGVQW